MLEMGRQLEIARLLSAKVVLEKSEEVETLLLRQSKKGKLIE